MSVGSLVMVPAAVQSAIEEVPSAPHAIVRDDERIQRVVDRECTFVWRSLRRFGVPSALADDATQTVFLTLAARIHDVPGQSERSFLVGTCLRVAANVRRSLARCKETANGVVEQHPSLHDPERLLELKQRRQALDLALDQLPHDQRVVFVLFELEGFSLPEVAESLGIPLGTATSRLRRARLRFEAWVKRRDKSGGFR